MLATLLTVLLAAPPTPTGFAVLELFTSEGCSSCPPADDLLAQLGREPGVLALAFHVDYWDRLGWADPFGSAAATARQHTYGQRLGGGRIYTPQLVVNGRRELVGSDADEARLAIAAAQAVPATVQLTLEGDPARGDARTASDDRSERPAAVGRSEGRVPPDGGSREAGSSPEPTAHTARWRLVGAPPGQVLNLALVERGLSVAVPRGENGGRTLRHEHVVRVFRTVPATETGAVTLDVPAAAKRENLMLIAYLQDPTTLAISAAARR